MHRTIWTVALACGAAIFLSTGVAHAGLDISSAVLHAFATVTDEDAPHGGPPPVVTNTDTPADQTFSGPFSNVTQSASAIVNKTVGNVSQTVTATSGG